MTDFLTGPALTKAVAQITKTGKAKLAVAFWGSDACKLLELPEDCSDLKVLCDAFSGACCPTTLEELLARKAEVKYVERVHAKAYIGPDGIVITSANASANGLGQESEEIDQHLEVGTTLTDVDAIQACHNWFDALFARASTLSKDQMPQLTKLWNMRRRHRPLSSRTENSNFSEILFQFPQLLKDRRIYAYAYKDEAIPEKVISTFQNSDFNDLTVEEHGNYEPFYYGASSWPIDTGDIIMDFALARTKIHFTGFWEVRGRIEKHDIVAVKLVQAPLGKPITITEKNKIRDAVQKAYEAGRVKLQELITAERLGELLE